MTCPPLGFLPLRIFPSFSHDFRRDLSPPIRDGCRRNTTHFLLWTSSSIRISLTSFKTLILQSFGNAGSSSFVSSGRGGSNSFLKRVRRAKRTISSRVARASAVEREPSAWEGKGERRKPKGDQNGKDRADGKAGRSGQGYGHTFFSQSNACQGRHQACQLYRET